MDTVMAKLPSEVGTILRENIAVIEIVSMFSIGAYNALETVFITFDIVQNYRSRIVGHSCACSSCYGLLLIHAPNLPISIPFLIGWYAMVTGQSVVLYSRLHLVLLNIRKVRWVLWMIIVNACILHVPMTVLFLSLNHGNARFARPAMIYNWIQLAGFCIQALVICGLYIYEATRALKCIIRIRGRECRKVIIHLLWVNVLVVILNILLLLTEYKLHFIQVSFKIVVYSIKLKLEFCRAQSSPLAGAFSFPGFSARPNTAVPAID
ncbi:hypothetical protein N7526_001949 [Penicillium atrosanguineum]|nr:hypothetical protein N7526_001949 [Penicillium atrosanguineum]